VDFFFVLSGFIIYHSTVAGKKPAKAYALGRARRIYLPYWPVGIAMAVLYSLLPAISKGDHVWGWLTTITLAPFFPQPALSVAWTLQHELFFYVLFGLLYYNRLLIPGCIMWGAAIVAGTLLRVEGGIPLSVLNLEFLMGIGAAILGERGGARSRWWYLAAFTVLAAWVVLGTPRELSIMVGLGFALAILPTVGLEERGRLVVPEWLVFLGAASYAIYLVHTPLLSIVGRVGSGYDPVLHLLRGATVSVLVGCLYYWLVERRLLRSG
jgi:peptidoglycan/LPS O-acetylase OafA/YrhL